METGKSPTGDDSVDSDQEDPSISSTNSYRSKKMKLDNGAPRNSGHSAHSSSAAGPEVNANTSHEPSNMIVEMAPSISNIRSIFLKARRYRKRSTVSSSSDEQGNVTFHNYSDSSSTISPDTSQSDSDDDTADTDYLSPDAHLEDPDRSSATDDSFYHDWTDDSNQNNGDDDDSDSAENTETDTQDGVLLSVKRPPVLLKQQPAHNWIAVKEIIKREMNLTFPMGRVGRTDVLFERKFISSLHGVYRLKKLHGLLKHRGCVNSISFHPEGDLLASGSDDLSVVIWDWAFKDPVHTIQTGHASNVFQSKFMYLNSHSQLDLVTSARDGQVKLVTVVSSGGKPSVRNLMYHKKPVHKVHTSPLQPHLVLSAGEDGAVMRADLRTDEISTVLQLKDKRRVTGNIPLYSIHGHPLDHHYMCIAGHDKFVRVYDARLTKKPVARYCPTFSRECLIKRKRKMKMPQRTHLTSAIYNHDGTEILGSYNDEDIYLFDTRTDVVNEQEDAIGYTHRYTGHRNLSTFKGVSFFGPNSEYVVSGSDCSYIYVWDKKTEAIVQWVKGDDSGVVNTIESHPKHSVLATSGLDMDVKIWMPLARDDPDYKGMHKVVRGNYLPQFNRPLFDEYLPTLYNAFRFRAPNVLPDDDDDEDSGPDQFGNLSVNGNVCTTF